MRQIWLLVVLFALWAAILGGWVALFVRRGDI